MSSLGNWPIGTCRPDNEGATATGDDLPQDTAPPKPPEPEEQAEASRKRRMTEREGFPVTSAFILFSVYPPAPMRSSIASAITFVAFTRSSIGQCSSGG